MTHWEELVETIRNLQAVADDGSMSVEEFAEYAMGALNEAVSLIELMGPVAREEPSVWRIDLDRHGLLFFVGTSDEARRFWHGRAYESSVIGGIHRSRRVSDAERDRYDEGGAHELEQPT